MTRTKGQATAERQAWAAYEQACQERQNHIYMDRCRECWSTADDNRNCLTWNILSAHIERTRDVWIKL